MTQPELFAEVAHGNMTVMEPVRREPLPDMRGYPPAVPVVNSIAAADKFFPHMNAKEMAVYEYMRGLPMGVTDNELISHFASMGWSGNTPRARRVALTDKGLVKQDGDRTVNGYKSAVWVVTNKEGRL